MCVLKCWKRSPRYVPQGYRYVSCKGKKRDNSADENTGQSLLHCEGGDVLTSHHHNIGAIMADR